MHRQPPKPQASGFLKQIRPGRNHQHRNLRPFPHSLDRNWLVRQELLGRSRYSMLAAVRLYAVDKLSPDAAEQLRQAHSRHFLRVFHATNNALSGGEYLHALARMDADIANFEAGFECSRQHQDHHAMIAAASWLSDYLRLKGRHRDRLQLAEIARTAAGNLDVATVAGAA